MKADDPELPKFYRRYGFVVIKGLLDSQECPRALQAARDLISNAPAQRGGAADALGRQCRKPDAYSFTDPVKADDPRTYLVP
eukprot:SAG31_NODE_3601_length_4085_cov_1.880582_5_plen_82_part_00